MIMKSEVKTNFSVSKNDLPRLITALAFLLASAICLWTALSCVSGRRSFSRGKTEVSASGVSSSQNVLTPSDASSAIDGESSSKEPAPIEVKHKNTDFVLVLDYIPDIEVELVYATDKNFTGQVIYDSDDAWLRYGTVKKLKKAQEKLKKQGVRLKVWDAFRPVSAQFRLWEVCPDPRFVSDPTKVFSSHSRGNTVDVTLVDMDGNELEMPTGFDDFTPLADREYSDVRSKAAVRNARLLERVMKECGFKPYSGEWWHFSDSVRYDVAEGF